MPVDENLDASVLRAQEARQAGLAAKRAEQPVNTMRSYAAKVREWKTWCSTPRLGPGGGVTTTWPDGELVTPDKLAAWLSEDILLRRVKPKSVGSTSKAAVKAEAVWKKARGLAKELSRPGDEPIPPEAAVHLLKSYEDKSINIDEVLATNAADEEGTLFTLSTVEAYVAAVMELWNQQVARGHSNTVNPRGAAVRGFLKQRGQQRARLDRENYIDRNIDGIQSGYTRDQWLEINSWLLNDVATHPQSLRTRLDLLFGHYYLLRGENRRRMEIADLSLTSYPSHEGPTPCHCLVLLIREGKTNETGKKEYMGSLRHKDPLFCTQGALAQSFFYRWHIAGEALPSFRRRQDWYRIKTLVGADRDHEIHYRTQLEETWRVYGAVGLASRAKTHLPRAAGAQEASLYGTPINQISSAGRWNPSTLSDAYLTQLPRNFLKTVAGFTESRGDYYLIRANIDPPANLQAKIWPWIEDWTDRFKARAQRLTWAQGGLNDDDIAGDSFIKLMAYLRVVLLQDLAVLEPRFPSLPFFQYPPFYGPEWDQYANEVRINVEEALEPASQLVQRALPEMCNIISTWQNRLLNSQQRIMSHVKGHDKRFDYLESQNAKLFTLAIKNAVNVLQEAASMSNEVAILAAEAMNPIVGLALATENTATATTQLVPRTEDTSSHYVATALPKVYTVYDVWRQYKIGLPGAPAGIEELETRFGSRWRPGNTLAVAIYRRKVVCNEVSRLIRSGQSEEAAIEAVDRMRAGRSISALAKALVKAQVVRRT
jgi:hypothetical protein